MSNHKEYYAKVMVVGYGFVFITKLQRRPSLGEREHNRSVAVEQSHEAWLPDCRLGEAPLRPWSLARCCQAIGRPPGSGALVQQVPPACGVLDFDLEQLAFKSAGTAGSQPGGRCYL